MSNKPNLDPTTVLPTYADPQAISDLSEVLNNFTGPETAYKDVYSDAKYVWKQSREDGEHDLISDPNSTEEGAKLLNISTLDLPGDWVNQPPCILSVRTSYIRGDGDQPKTKILDFELSDELGSDSEPLYLGSLSFTKKVIGQRLPELRYDLGQADSLAEWTQLTPQDFEYNTQNKAIELVTTDKPTAEQLQLKTLLATLESVEEYFYEREGDNSHEAVPRAIGKYGIRAIADRLKNIDV